MSLREFEFLCTFVHWFWKGNGEEQSVLSCFCCVLSEMTMMGELQVVVLISLLN